jgi:hypothetical protein
VREKNRIIVSIVAFVIWQAVSMPVMIAANPHIMLFINVVRISLPDCIVGVDGALCSLVAFGYGSFSD